MPICHILLVDDDVDDQEIFLSALAALPGSIQCTTISDPATALQQLTAEAIIPQLIFVDLNMPIMNGQQFLQAVKEQQALKDIPVIVYSTSAMPATIKQVLELGAVDFITKPDKFDALINILRSVIHREAS